MKKYKCPCCGHSTFENAAGGSFEICPVCYWEDDKLQFENSDFSGGANEVSLNEAKANYIRFGATELRFLPFVRKPGDDE